MTNLQVLLNSSQTSSYSELTIVKIGLPITIRDYIGDMGMAGGGGGGVGDRCERAGVTVIITSSIYSQARSTFINPLTPWRDQFLNSPYNIIILIHCQADR